MDSIRVSEAPDPGSIPGEATKNIYVYVLCVSLKNLDHDFIYKGHCVNPEVSSKPKAHTIYGEIIKSNRSNE